MADIYLSNQLLASPIQEKDIQAAIFKASLFKALGQDSLPTLVWQELWPILYT